MRMLMVDIRIVWMSMGNQIMMVAVYMRLTSVPGEIVCMLVMFIVTVRVGVLERLVCVDVLVPFSKVEPYADAHENPCCPEERTGQLRP